MRAVCLAALVMATPAFAGGDLHRAAIAHDAAGPPGDLMLGATLAALGMHASAAAVYQRIAARAERAELVALAPLAMRTVRAAPHERTRAALRAYAPADAALFRNGADRAMFLYQLGRTPDVAGAEAALAAVDDRTHLHGHAQLALAELKWRRGDVPGAIAAALQAERSHYAQLDAARLLATWAHTDDPVARPRAAVELRRRAEATNSLARFEHGRLAVEKAGLMPGLERASVQGGEAIIFGAACGARESDDLAVPFELALPEQVRVLDAVLAIADDNALVDELTRSRPTMPEQVMAIALDRLDVREYGRWLEALDEELALHAAAPVTWRESRLGIRLRTQLERWADEDRRSLGALARRVLVQLRADMSTLAGAVASRTGPIPLRRNGTWPEVGFSLGACGRVQDPRPRPEPTTRVPPPWKCGTGCAGCSSSGNAGLAVALALVWLFRSRRRSTTIGACSPG